MKLLQNKNDSFWKGQRGEYNLGHDRKQHFTAMILCCTNCGQRFRVAQEILKYKDGTISAKKITHVPCGLNIKVVKNEIR